MLRILQLMDDLHGCEIVDNHCIETGAADPEVSGYDYKVDKSEQIFLKVNLSFKSAYKHTYRGRCEIVGTNIGCDITSTSINSGEDIGCYVNAPSVPGTYTYRCYDTS